MRTRYRVRDVYVVHGLLAAIKSLIVGSSSYDGLYPDPFWTFRKGVAYDLRNAPQNFWTQHAHIMPVKPEGAPIEYIQESYDGVPVLGNWWSIQFKLRRFVVRFRYRSWTRNIFYITIL